MPKPYKFKRKEIDNITAQKKKKKKAARRSPCAHAHGHFLQSRKNATPLNFLSILGRKHFGKLREKTIEPTIYFSSFSPNQTDSKKNFLHIFSS